MKAVKFIFIFSQKTKKPSNRKAFKVKYSNYFYSSGSASEWNVILKPA